MDVRKTIADAGCVLEGQFFFALKKRPNVSTKYINIDPLFTYPQAILVIGAMLAHPWEGEYDVIAGPAVGGIPVVYSVANGSNKKDVRAVWADKQEDGTFALERMGFVQAVRGKRVLVVEDVTSTGSSTLAVCDLVRENGGILVGASVIWNRGNVTEYDVGAPKLHCLVTESVTTYKADEHPMWGTWPLVEDIGHPDHFPDYPGPRIKLLS